jgi:hypothetical protein
MNWFRLSIYAVAVGVALLLLYFKAGFLFAVAGGLSAAAFYTALVAIVCVLLGRV